MRRRLSSIATVLAAAGLLFLLAGGSCQSSTAVTTGAQAKALVKQGALLLDVRTPEEFASGHLEGAVNIPVSDLGGRLAELQGKQDTDIVVYCQSGRRSAAASALLTDKGFKKVHDLGAKSNWNSGG